ncbi:MAG: hypothetical protein II423_01905 [Erysipelotrichaceae bacterium]|nr:hypothetical protein [Erysipelotrichaceae bacterium]
MSKFEADENQPFVVINRKSIVVLVTVVISIVFFFDRFYDCISHMQYIAYRRVRFFLTALSNYVFLLISAFRSRKIFLITLIRGKEKNIATEGKRIASNKMDSGPHSVV